MSNDIKILDDILYHGLRPWLEQNTLNEKFAAMLGEVKVQKPAFTFQYEIHFEWPFNHKTKYYNKLILNETIQTINQLHQLITEDDNTSLVKYWLNDTLEKKLKTRLRDIGKLIKEQDYALSYINPKKTAFDIDQNHKANTFIVQLLKLAYMHMYMELQEVFKSHIEDQLIVDDFYTQLLFEPVPDKLPINKIKILEVQPDLKPSVALEPEGSYGIHSFTYKQYHTAPDKLKDLCDSLKKHGFIDQDTTVPNFKKVFSGEEVTNPVHWTQSFSALYYFIKLIHSDFELVENLKQDHWKITSKCFVKKDGTLFDNSKFRGQKRPATADLLEKVVEHIK